MQPEALCAGSPSMGATIAKPFQDHNSVCTILVKAVGSPPPLSRRFLRHRRCRSHWCNQGTPQTAGGSQRSAAGLGSGRPPVHPAPAGTRCHPALTDGVQIGGCNEGPRKLFAFADLASRCVQKESLAPLLTIRQFSYLRSIIVQRSRESHPNGSSCLVLCEKGDWLYIVLKVTKGSTR